MGNPPSNAAEPTHIALACVFVPMARMEFVEFELNRFAAHAPTAAAGGRN